MANTARAKYQDSGAPPSFRASLPENPRKDFDCDYARPSGRSGGVPCDTPHRVSSSVRKSKPRSRRRG